MKIKIKEVKSQPVRVPIGHDKWDAVRGLGIERLRELRELNKSFAKLVDDVTKITRQDAEALKYFEDHGQAAMWVHMKEAVNGRE